jgi:hypothetical protein
VAVVRAPARKFFAIRFSSQPRSSKHPSTVADRDTHRYYGTALSHTIPDAKLTLQAYDTYLALTQTLEKGVQMVFAPQGFTAGVVKAGKARNGGNSMGLYEGPQVCKSLCQCLAPCVSSTRPAIDDHSLICFRIGHDVYVTFPEPAQAQGAQKAVDSWTSTTMAAAKKANVWLPYIYLNNGNLGSKVLSGYGRQNFEFIKQTARKYDPTSVMQRLQNDGFLIRKEQ